MARFAPLVWAVPTTLAVLVLAKSALQSRSTPAGADRVSPALVERLELPGRLHAPRDAQPVRNAAVPSHLPTPLAGPLDPAATEVSATVEEAFSPSAESTEPRLAASEDGDVLYPVTQVDDLPQLSKSWLGANADRSSQRLPHDPQQLTLSGPATASEKPSPTISGQALTALGQQVATMNDKAIQLARRGALYSARAELIDALRLTAQAYDAQAGQAEHAAALAAALTAMEESDDFAQAFSRHLSALTDIVRPHRTPVLKRIDVSKMSPLTCQQHYYAYAQQQLSRAVESDAIAAQSLHLLGKVHTHLAGEAASSRSTHVARAIVFHQATLAIEPRHHQSANELGVLLARFGELAAAKQMLISSVTHHATSSAWQNLASVHDRLGEHDLAHLARNEADLLTGKSPRSSQGHTVEWVDPATFAAQGTADGGDAPAERSVRASAAAATTSRNQAVRR